MESQIEKVETYANIFTAGWGRSESYDTKVKYVLLLYYRTCFYETQPMILLLVTSEMARE